jgi:hypothetical protein
MVDTMKRRSLFIALFVGGLMFVQPVPVFADQGLTTVICADPEGNQVTRQIGWDNSNQFFEGRGYIPKLYCEGGYAGPYTTYISDDLPIGSPLGWYAGLVPTPEPSPSQTMTIEPTPLPSPIPTLVPSPEPTPIPTQVPEPLPTPTPSEPPPVPTVTPEPPSEPTPLQTPPAPPTPQPEPPTPAPEPPVLASPPPSLAPEPPAIAPAPPIAIELPPLLADLPGAAQVLAAAEAIMNVGNDMTPEQREESQSVVVGAVLVGQIAASIRRVK